MTDDAAALAAARLTAMADTLHAMGLCRTKTAHTRRAHEPDAERLLAALPVHPPAPPAMCLECGGLGHWTADRTGETFDCAACGGSGLAAPPAPLPLGHNHGTRWLNCPACGTATPLPLDAE